MIRDLIIILLVVSSVWIVVIKTSEAISCFLEKVEVEESGK